MRKHILYFIALLPFMASCSDDIFSNPQGSITMSGVEVTLEGSDNMEGLDVQLRNISTNSIFTQTTDTEGRTIFKVPPGTYEVTASGKRAEEGIAYTYNGTSGLVVVRSNEPSSVVIAMKSAQVSQIVVKEIYVGGCMRDDGVTTFQFDKCIILYNNSDQRANVSNLCIAQSAPANGHSNNKNYNADGKLTYESEGFIPAWNGLFYFPSALEIEPYSQVVVNLNGAIDNTLTISQSVNYAHPDYYCAYDPESGYDNTSYYPTPSSVIPTSHYLKALRLGLGNALPISVSAPALVLFQVKDTDPVTYATTPENQWYDGAVAQVNICAKVPNNWIMDGIEVFSALHKTDSKKRLTADIDAGYVWLTNYQGHALYRNVDKEATEALPENDGLLVYQYSLGVDDSTDPSGIDAEASMKNGAHIIFQDTNNSTNDFHERQECSLRRN